MKLGKAIHSARLAFGWTQKELGKNAGLAVSYISRIENGRIQPTMATVGRIARALDTSASELMRHAEDFPSIKGHRCPVSHTGQCIGEQIRSARGPRPEGQGAAYGEEALDLLRMTEMIATRGNAELRRALAIMLESLVDKVGDGG